MPINYNPEDLVLWNAFARAKRYNKNLRWTTHFEFPIERTFSREEKIEFINKYDKHPGILTYATDLIDKWLAERDSLPQDAEGWVKTNSLKAWLRKNDTEHIADDFYHHGYFEIRGEPFGLDLNTRSEAHNSLKDYETIRKLFHRECEMQCIAEECIYLEQDPKAKKFQEIRSFARAYGDFGIQMLCDFEHNYGSEQIVDIDEKLMDTIISMFESYRAVHNKFAEDIQQLAKDSNWRSE